MTGAAAVAASGGRGFSVSVSPTSVSGTGTQTGIATATVVGGQAPFSYAWPKSFGDDLTAQSPTAAATRFAGTPPPAILFAATFTCQVTDSNGFVVTSNGVGAQLTGA